MLLLVYSLLTRGLTSGGEMCHVFFKTMGGLPLYLGPSARAPVSESAFICWFSPQFGFTERQRMRRY